MSDVVIRPAQASDLSHLAEIEMSAAEAFAAYGQPLADGSSAAPREQWDAALAAGLLWVASDAKDGPVGFLRAEITADGLYVDEVDVRLDHQRRGHGRRLMRASIAAAKSMRLQAVTLTTFRDIPWNAPFYATLGFRALSPAETSTHLAGKLADQAARGLEGRCAMRLPL